MNNYIVRSYRDVIVITKFAKTRVFSRDKTLIFTELFISNIMKYGKKIIE